jgi:hypothetical protein
MFRVLLPLPGHLLLSLMLGELTKILSLGGRELHLETLLRSKTDGQLTVEAHCNVKNGPIESIWQMLNTRQ